jgi:hypothetical protein
MSTSDDGTCQCCPRCRCRVTSTWVKIFLSLSSYRPNIFFCTHLPSHHVLVFVCLCAAYTIDHYCCWDDSQYTFRWFLDGLHIQLITTVVEMILSILFVDSWMGCIYNWSLLLLSEMILSILFVDSWMGSNAMSIMPCIQLRGFIFSRMWIAGCRLSACMQRQQEHGVGDRGWSYWRKEVLTSISITKTSSPAYLLCYVYIVWSCLLSLCSAHTTLTTRRTLHCTSFGVIHLNSRRAVVVLFKPFLSLLVLAEGCRVPS